MMLRAGDLLVGRNPGEMQRTWGVHSWECHQRRAACALAKRCASLGAELPLRSAAQRASLSRCELALLSVASADQAD